MSKAEAAAPGRSKIFFLWSYQASNIYEGSWYIRGFAKVFLSIHFPIIKVQIFLAINRSYFTNSKGVYYGETVKVPHFS